MRARRVAAPLALLVVASASGCSVYCGVDGSGRVSVTADTEANRGSATAIDLVAVEDEALVDKLAGIDAAAWFAGRGQFERDNPDSLSVTGWEIAPGQSIEPQKVSFPCGTEGLFLFASLSAPGSHRVRLPALDDLAVTVHAESVEVSP